MTISPAAKGLSRAVCGGLECYKALDAKHRMDWDTRVVGIAHGQCHTCFRADTCCSEAEQKGAALEQESPSLG